MRDPAPLPRPAPFMPREKRLFLAILAVGLVLRWVYLDLGWLSFHVTRDLYRALELLSLRRFPLLGSELSYGGRVMGPFVYFLYAVPLAFSSSPLGVAIFVMVVNTATWLLTFVFVRRFWGTRVALLTMALMSCFPLEIFQTRFYWNPCFLPPMVLGFVWALMEVIVAGKRWHILTCLLFWSLAFQLHFSALFLLLVFGVLVVLWRPRVRGKVWGLAALMVFLLFTPYWISEATTGLSNTVEMLSGKWARKERSQRFRFNPNTPIVALHHLYLEPDEFGEQQGFTYLANFRIYQGEVYPAWANGAFEVLLTLAHAQRYLFYLGLLVIVGRMVWLFRRGGPEGRAGPEMRCSSLLLCQMFLPFIGLCFFSFHPPPPGYKYSVMAIRYFLVCYPAQFITMSIGALWLTDFLLRRGWMLALRLFWVLVAAVLAGQIIFCFALWHIILVTGKVIPYYNRGVSCIREELQIVGVLVDEFRIHPDTYYTHVDGIEIFRPEFGETSLDYLITQCARAYDNPKGPPDVYYMIYHDDEKRFPGPDVEVLETRAVNRVRISKYRFRNPGQKPAVLPGIRNFFVPHMDFLRPFWERPRRPHHGTPEATHSDK